MTFTIKTYQEDKLVTKELTHKKRRFLKKIRSINWQTPLIKAYVKVSEGNIPYHNTFVECCNEGDYTNKADFWQSVNAFLEE